MRQRIVRVFETGNSLLDWLSHYQIFKFVKPAFSCRMSTKYERCLSVFCFLSRDTWFGETETEVKALTSDLSGKIPDEQQISGRLDTNMGHVQGVSKRVLQWYSKCCCVFSVTKTFTLKGVRSIQRSRCWTMGSLYTFKCTRFRNTSYTVTFGIPLYYLFLKHPAITVEVTLNRNYPR
jgi:hypothetical protein